MSLTNKLHTRTEGNRHPPISNPANVEAYLGFYLVGCEENGTLGEVLRQTKLAS